MIVHLCQTRRWGYAILIGAGSLLKEPGSEPGKPVALRRWFVEPLTGVVLREVQIQIERFADFKSRQGVCRRNKIQRRNWLFCRKKSIA